MIEKGELTYKDVVSYFDGLEGEAVFPGNQFITSWKWEFEEGGALYVNLSPLKNNAVFPNDYKVVAIEKVELE